MSGGNQHSSRAPRPDGASGPFLSLAFLQQRIDVSAAPLQNEKPELVLRSGAMLKKLSLGYDPLLADIYWTRAVQYFGERVGSRGATFELLGPLLDITTTLDPQADGRLSLRGNFFVRAGSRPARGAPDLAVRFGEKRNRR